MLHIIKLLEQVRDSYRVISPIDNYSSRLKKFGDKIIKMEDTLTWLVDNVQNSKDGFFNVDLPTQQLSFFEKEILCKVMNAKNFQTDKDVQKQVFGIV